MPKSKHNSTEPQLSAGQWRPHKRLQLSQGKGVAVDALEFSSLPKEVVGEVAKFLPWKDFASFTLASRATYQHMQQMRALSKEMLLLLDGEQKESKPLKFMLDKFLPDFANRVEETNPLAPIDPLSALTRRQRDSDDADAHFSDSDLRISIRLLQCFQNHNQLLQYFQNSEVAVLKELKFFINSPSVLSDMITDKFDIHVLLRVCKVAEKDIEVLELLQTFIGVALDKALNEGLWISPFKSHHEEFLSYLRSKKITPAMQQWFYKFFYKFLSKQEESHYFLKVFIAGGLFDSMGELDDLWGEVRNNPELLRQYRSVVNLCLACIFNQGQDFEDGLHAVEEPYKLFILRFAAFYGRNAMVKTLLRNITGPLEVTYNDFAASPLPFAAVAGQHKVMETLLNDPRININFSLKLLDSGVVYFDSELALTALASAVIGGHLSTVEKLCAVPGVDLVCSNIAGSSDYKPSDLLGFAAAFAPPGNFLYLRQKWQELGKSAEQIGAAVQAGFCLALKFRPTMERAEFLLQQGADVNKAAFNNDFPLRIVCQEMHTEEHFKIFKLLLLRGADPNLCTPDTMFAVKNALVALLAHIRNPALTLRGCQLLMEYRLNLLYVLSKKDARGRTFLHVMCAEGLVGHGLRILCELLWCKYNKKTVADLINSSDNNGCTPLQLLIRAVTGSEKYSWSLGVALEAPKHINDFLVMGARINAVDSAGMPVFHEWANRCCISEIIEPDYQVLQLFSNAGDLRQRDKEGNSLLHQFCLSVFRMDSDRLERAMPVIRKAVTLFLSLGLSFADKNDQEKTPLDMLEEIARLINGFKNSDSLFQRAIKFIEEMKMFEEGIRGKNKTVPMEDVEAKVEVVSMEDVGFPHRFVAH